MAGGVSDQIRLYGVRVGALFFIFNQNNRKPLR